VDAAGLRPAVTSETVHYVMFVGRNLASHPARMRKASSTPTIGSHGRLDGHGGNPTVAYPRLLSLLALLALSFACRAEAQDVSAVGGWTETIDSSDLVSGAGSDLTDTYESSNDATTLDITHDPQWHVDIHRTDTIWSPDFTLYAKRTSEGTGSGSISGGISYIEVTAVGTQFFTGSQDRSGIDVQYQLTGVSVGISPGTYTTTVTYTVVDN
jgi:hypothetical protein